MVVLKKANEVKLKTLEDEKNGLYWEMYDRVNWTSFADNERVIDEWSSDSSVKKFVSKRRPISRHLTSLVNHKKNMFYAYANNKIVGVVLVSRPEKDYDFATIDYIVVDPKIHGCGIGARMVSSIKENGEFFATGYMGKIDAYVDNHNYASQSVLKKSGFVAERRSGANGFGGYFRGYFEDRS